MKNIAYTLLFGILLFTACSTSTRTVFSQKFYKNSGLSAEDLKKVQFYVDRDIILERSIDQGSTMIEGGKVLIKGGKKIQEVIIRSGTKGVLTYMPKDDRMGISFDAKNADNYLMFGPNPKNNNRYTLLAENWNKNYGVISYGGAKWTTSASAATATLLIEYSDNRTRKTQTKVESGRSVGSN
ncbi:MAG TPA: hypothetical protein PK076_10210 [Saprospiraceae bacterium]|nr:hypothetical protein [Saprospiraceae bacterium]HQW56492.1 hypothetical protein [Saprospiraceae bacterium]